MSDEPKKPSADEQIERLVHDAIRLSGWMPPVTEQEVASAEEELAAGPIELPPGLQDSDAVMQRLSQCAPSTPLRHPATAETVANLARAAREGGQITPEVEARMRADRETAEREADRQK